MDWKAEAQNKNAAPITPGIYELTVTRILWRKKDAAEDYRTQNGDPAPKLVVRDDEGREGLMTMVLSDKAKWTMARLLSCCGVDLDGMTKAGITIDHFKDKQWAETCLIKKPRRFLASVKAGASGHMEVTPIHPEDADKVGAVEVAISQEDPDSIPF